MSGKTSMKSTQKHKERKQYFTCGIATIVANQPAQETRIDRIWNAAKSALRKWAGFDTPSTEPVVSTPQASELPEAA